MTQAPPDRTDAEDGDHASAQLAKLIELVRILRERCPWDRRQTHLSLAPHLLEETYEALDAIESLALAGRGSESRTSEAVAHLEEELGDVLFQVFFHSQLASEEEWFGVGDVARSIHQKLVARHPHVFADASADTAEDVAARWEILKRNEKRRRGVTDTIPDAMPALALASKLLKKADSLGLELPSPSSSATRLKSVADLLEQTTPATAEATERSDPQAIASVGRALLAFVDLARRARIDPELALRAASQELRSTLEAWDTDAADVEASDL